jgi:hypothetical protein
MRFHFPLAGLLLFALGCGGDRVVPVSGRVTLDDKPVANATVVFQPISEDPNPGPGSHGKTDAEGKFTLELTTGKKTGALIGLHKVVITAYEGDDEIPSSGSDMVFRKRILPDTANGSDKVTFEVPQGGTTEANFDFHKAAPK